MKKDLLGIWKKHDISKIDLDFLLEIVQEYLIEKGINDITALEDSGGTYFLSVRINEEYYSIFSSGDSIEMIFSDKINGAIDNEYFNVHSPTFLQDMYETIKLLSKE